LYLGLEIGATKQQVALGDIGGTLLRTIGEKVPLPNGAADVQDWLKAKIPLLIAQGRELGGTVRAIGVGFGGVVESSTGRIRISVQVPGWQDFPLRDWLEQSFGLPTVIVNDTVAGGYGELCCGSGTGAKNFFYSNIGSGIGGALFLDRIPYDGLGLGAAYIGHTYVPDWTVPQAGQENKLENICSGWSIEKRLRTPGYVPAHSSLMSLCNHQVSTITCAMLGQAARQGDAFSLAEIERIATTYAIALSNLITLAVPDVIAIGGGVANLGDSLLEPMRCQTARRVFLCAKDQYRIVRCAFVDQAVPIGATLFARDLYRTTRKDS
jgi:glucokinase